MYVELSTSPSKPKYVYVQPNTPFNTNIVKTNTYTKNIEFADTKYVKIGTRYYGIVVDDNMSDEIVMFDGPPCTKLEAAAVVPARKVFINVLDMKFDSEVSMRAHIDGWLISGYMRWKSQSSKDTVGIIDTTTIVCCPNVDIKIDNIIYYAKRGTDSMNKHANVQYGNDKIILPALYNYSDDKNKQFVSHHDFEDMTDKEIAAKLTSIFKEKSGELYIYGVDLIIGYVNKDNFNVYLFNHLRKLWHTYGRKLALQHACGSNMYNFW